MSIQSFAELSVSDSIKQALEEMGFKDPSPIQAQAIPAILEGRDVVGQAQTGTGKTAAFGIPIIESIDPELKKAQAIVLCPTRELAEQVMGEIKKIAKFSRGVGVTAIYGGQSYDRQIKALKDGVQIVVGTPGRVIDHIDRGTLKLESIKMFVLDEADEMLNMGFRDDIETILSEATGEGRQTILFSATMPKAIQDIARRFQKDPLIIKVTREELTTTTITQKYYEVRDDYRTEAITRLITANAFANVIVFCNTKVKVDNLVDELNQKGVLAEGLHGDMQQAQRNNVMKKFKEKRVQVLVATDVAARGIDVDNLEAVINFDLPMDEESYVHRIGRTGRAGKQGNAISLVTGRKDQRRIQDIERFTKASIEKCTIPSSGEIKQIRRNKFSEYIQEYVNTNNLDEALTSVNQFLENGISAETLAAALLSMHQAWKVDEAADNIELRDSGRGDRGGNDRFAGRERSGDRFGRDRERGGREREPRSGGDRFGRDREPSRERSGDRERAPRSDSPRTFTNDGDSVRLFINLGRQQNVRPGDIVGALAGEARVSGREIGQIDIFDKYTFVNVPSSYVDPIIDAMRNNTIKGHKVNIEVAN
jgi:ATP-dependent RNA helicase DeaD